MRESSGDALKAGCSAVFAMGKFALRAWPQSMARELAPKGIHVAHFVSIAEKADMRVGSPSSITSSEKAAGPPTATRAAGGEGPRTMAGPLLSGHKSYLISQAQLRVCLAH